MWKAVDNPLAGLTGGRPCSRTEGLVTKLVVFRESHKDGDYHFHVAVQLRQSRAFAAAKRTLRERDMLAAHFSSSHTQFWSAVRYGYIPTASKPVVDNAPLSWSETGGWGALDLLDESQRPWAAELWKKRREDWRSKSVIGEVGRTPLDLKQGFCVGQHAAFFGALTGFGEGGRSRACQETAALLQAGLDSHHPGQRPDVQGSTSGLCSRKWNRGDAAVCAQQPEKTKGDP